MTKRGVFICIEGIDVSGETTHAVSMELPFEPSDFHNQLTKIFYFHEKKLNRKAIKIGLKLFLGKDL